MKKVISLSPGTIIESCEIHVQGQATLYLMTGEKITFALIDESGRIMKSIRDGYEIYATRDTAQEIADLFNRHSHE